MKVRVIVTGRGYDTAANLPPELDLPEGATTVDAVAEIARHLPAGRRLSDATLLAIASQHLGTIGRHAPRTLRAGDELVLIAPVAGGN